MSVKLKTPSNGSVTLAPEDTASDVTITVPAGTGELIYANSSGNVGIGTSSPSRPLTVNGSIQFASGGVIECGTTALNTYIAGIQGSSGYWAFATNGSERARLDASGNLLVGTTSLPSAGSGGVGFQPTTASRTLIRCSTSVTTSAGLIVFQNPNGEVGSILTSASATTYATSSDYRLKNITGNLTGYKERLMSLKPKQGTWKADGSEFRGFVAHEFADSYRASVTGEKDAVDKDGKPIYQGMQAGSSEVMADLVALVQEQQAQIEQLRAEIEALKGN